jgi:hypothetical protein
VTGMPGAGPLCGFIGRAGAGTVARARWVTGLIGPGGFAGIGGFAGTGGLIGAGGTGLAVTAGLTGTAPAWKAARPCGCWTVPAPSTGSARDRAPSLGRARCTAVGSL